MKQLTTSIITFFVIAFFILIILFMVQAEGGNLEVEGQEAQEEVVSEE